MTRLIQNFILFQIGWFACVLGGASQDYVWLGTFIVALIVFNHVLRAPYKTAEMTLIMFTGLIGTFWDSALTMAGLYQFHAGAFISGLAPHWLIAMWVLFATTLNVSMRWLHGRYLLAAVFGGIGGPLAYYAGHKLGAVDFNDTTASLIAIAIGWILIMPLLVFLTKFYNGYPNLNLDTLKVEAT